MSPFRQLAFAVVFVVCLVLAVRATTPPASKIAKPGGFDPASPLISNSAGAEKRVVVENDGWRLVGDLRIPRSRRPVPAVILLNKANGDRKVYVELAHRLADRGIASLRVDLRGHGESTNKGKFVPFQENSTEILNDTDKDIVTVIKYLSSVKGIDAKRIGVVGASYSGEEMAVAARQHGYERAYVALSPGSFSEESINEIDRSGAAWLFVKSSRERAKSLEGFYGQLFQTSQSAQTIELPGTEHATDILTAHTELAEILAVWFAHKL